MAVSSQGEDWARQIIQEIVAQHGFVRESTLQSISQFVNQDARREIEEALLAKDRRIGSSVLTLAKNLYTSQARFVFELLQNADDNAFTQGQDPYVAFQVHPDRIIIECNEDGFTERNIKAICDIGKSSKTGSRGYIGEKGIGFKSVFMAAWRVHIQSGQFSFDFVHRKGDSGMGMVTPIWQENRDDTLRFALTRITLHLHEYLDPNDLERDRQIITQQFHELQDTLLLFLRNLRKIEVLFFDQDGSQASSTVFTVSRSHITDAAVIERTYSDAAQNRQRTYHIVNHTARGLSRREESDFSESEGSTASLTTSEIVLAFPVVEDPTTLEEVPVIEPQEVFAFLPVRKMGFNFLIQADFATLANRQDIVLNSRRNRGLIEAIADAFMAGVEQLSQCPALEYKWMRYLPLENSYPWDGLWADLVASIKARLSNLRIFRSLERGTRRKIRDLYDRGPELNDEYGNPLFTDLNPEIYLSDSYGSSDRTILENFGLRTIAFDQIIDLVKQDLRATSAHSRIKGVETEDTWNTRTYTLLNTAWSLRHVDRVRDLRRLNIIPLQNGSWSSVESRDIFYPNYGEIIVPRSLGMRLIDPMITTNEARCEFFDNLGVRRIDTTMILNIRQRILRYQEEPLTIVDLRGSIEQMRFLFLTQHFVEGDEFLASEVLVYNHLNLAMLPDLVDIYTPDDSPYGADRFLRQTGRHVNCVNLDYFDNIPSVAPASNFTLHHWMHRYLGIRQNLRLVSYDRASLSAECLDTAATRPAEFLGFLSHLWPLEGRLLLTLPSLVTAMKNTRILCMNGKMERLCRTYIPLQPLLDAHRQCLRDEYFPFIQLAALSSGEQVPDSWSFLITNLGVEYRDNIRFRLQLMKSLKEANSATDMLVDPVRVIEIYQSLDACLRMTRNSEASKRRIISDFDKHKLILIDPDNMRSAWRRPSHCLWEAPAYFTSKFPLKESFTSASWVANTQLNHLAVFFRETLKVADVDWSDVVEELKAMRSTQIVEIENVRHLFGILSDKLPIEDDDKQELRQSFDEEALIYICGNGTSSWYRPSDCVWSDTTHIHGKIAVNAHYSELKDLFVEQLLVPELDLKMVYDQLLATRSHNLSVPEVKALLKTLNSFLRTDPNPPNPGRLLSTRIFPIREPNNGNVVLHTSTTEFIIIDREGPPSGYKDLVKILDFTLQEIRYLQPLLAWLGLESRYLSRCMSEISHVGNGTQSPISEPHRDLKIKAFALLRITAAFNSPRYVANPIGLYGLLRTAVTVECGLISSSLSLEQDGTTHEIEIGRSELHIDNTNPLKIYVPTDRESQECCFKFDLPHRFSTWMMTDPVTGTRGRIEEGAVNVINSILNCLVSTTDRILEKEGIPHISGIAEILDPSFEPSVPITSTALVVANTSGRQVDAVSQGSRLLPVNGRLSSSNSALARPPEPQGNGTQAHPILITDIGEYSGTHTRSNVDLNHVLPIPAPQFQAPAQHSDSQYRLLLECVVLLARRTSLPSNNPNDISAALQILSIRDNLFQGVHLDGPSLINNWEYRKRIGAAGELFVFTILSGIQSLQFGLENWRSSIRDYANILPEYSNLRAWPGRETSDIVYEDLDGSLTSLMITLGYLNNNWSGRRPKYYIEVKCTTGACETPFSLGQAQVNLMELYTNGREGNENQDTIYAIFRVFRLGRNDMGLKIYVDPAEQRRVGKLAFSADKYSVIPTRPRG